MKSKKILMLVTVFTVYLLFTSCTHHEPSPEVFEPEMEVAFRQIVAWSFARIAYDEELVNRMERQVDKQYQKSLWQNNNIFFKLFPKPISHYPEKYNEAILEVEKYFSIFFSVMPYGSKVKGKKPAESIKEILDVVSTIYLTNDVEFEDLRIVDEMYTGYIKKTIWEAVEINSGARVQYEIYNHAYIPSAITIKDLDKAVAYVIDATLDEEEE